MKRRNLLLTLMVMVIFTAASFAQGVVRGVVQDVNTDETLIGATVVIEGTTIGVTTNLDGSFLLIVPAGDHKLAVRFVGYETNVIDISVKDGSTYNLGTILVKSSAIGLDEVNVLASIAIDRKTPVAVSTIDAKTIADNLGSQEFPEIMKTTPNVYVTKQGGGFGDARINVRGFDQRNVAVMINGIPVNDMENGWVYWSNWAGLGDATRSIQIQRGLGANKLAINSVGGTINIVTKTTDMNKGGSISMEATDYGRFKTMLSLSTGKLKSGTAVTFVGSRTFGKGYVDATWVSAWSYFLSVSQDIGKAHQIAFTVVGAPQQHGQRDGYYMLDSAMYNKYGTKYTKNWGYRGGEVLNERVNYYHKPQMALNWYWTISEKAFLATSAYLSFGTGGGSGPLGFNAYDANGVKHYTKYEPPVNASGQYDWDLLAEQNANEEWHNIDDGDTTFYAAGESKHIIRNSVNNHTWMGILSTLTYNLSEAFTLTAGIDGRHYKGEHYREVRDLVGGDYWSDRAFGKTVVGDKIAYWNDGIVIYGGAFAQLEYSAGNFDAFLGATASNTWTKRIDYYNYTPGEGEESETLTNMGYNVKVGANYNINEQNNVFVNAGYYSRVPFFRFMFLNYVNDVNPDLKNEKITSFEFGYQFKTQKFRAQFNAYYSIWDDISVLTGFTADDGSYVNAFMSDLKEVHSGIEVNLDYQAARWLNLSGLFATGNWIYANDGEAVLYDDATHTEIGKGTIYTKDLKVPNQPQTMAGLFANIQATKSIDFGINYLYYADIYADFTPESRKTEADREQSWKLPNYGSTDVRFGWKFKLAGLDSKFNMNIYNVFNVEALVEAEDKQVKLTDAAGTVTGYEHTFKKGFWNWGRNFNFSLKVNF